VSVKGRLQTKQWVDQKNERHSVTEVVADMFDGVTVLSGASGQANAKPASQRESAQVSPATSDADNAEKGAEDEVPF
jgi:single-stranded DNA-binding protein